MAVDFGSRHHGDALDFEAHLYTNPSPGDLRSLSLASPERNLHRLVWCQLNIKKMSSRKRKQDVSGPATFKGEYSFVNKDASNIDSKDHNSAVSWHVMNRYERWKKQEQAKKLRASASIPASLAASVEGSYISVSGPSYSHVCCR